MSGITGKDSLSYKKQDVAQSRVPALGFKKTVFAHKATAGQTVISLSSLTTPTEMTANGFQQASLAELTSVNIRQFKENFTLSSSLRGILQPFLGYVVTGGTSIKLLFSAEDGEIFTGVFDANPRTFTSAADAIPISVSGTLLAGQTDFNVGTAFNVGLFPGSQHGAILVFANDRLVYRNASSPTGPGTDGDYYEVPAGNGLGVMIRFNVADPVYDRSISVVSIGSLIQAPSGSEVALIEALQGQVDSIIPTLAALAGVPESTFQGAPNNVNLKAFGDTVLSNTTRITALENPTQSEVWVYVGNGYGSTNTVIRRFTTVGKNVGAGINYVDSATLGASFTIVEAGIYAIEYSDEFNAGSNFGISCNSNQLTTQIATITAAHRLVASNTLNANEGKTVTVTLRLEIGDVIRPHAQGTAGGAATWIDSFRITKVR